MEFQPKDVDNTFMYRTITTSVVPRPIAWVSSRAANGDENLAPFSFFNVVSDSEPPVVMFSPGTKDGDLKDTTRNIEETEEFVINIVSPNLATQMDKTSERLPPSESEFEYADVTQAPAEKVTPRRVANSPVSLECVLYGSEKVGEHTMILGEVVYVYVNDDLITEGKIDAEKTDTVGRIGGPLYTKLDRLSLESDTIQGKLMGERAED